MRFISTIEPSNRTNPSPGFLKNFPWALSSTQVGVSYIQFGYWQKAQDIFLGAMAKCQGVGMSNVTKAEKIVWEEQWIVCAKQLNQWEVLKEYATDVNQFDLLLESCWKTDSWIEIKEALADPMPSDASQTKVGPHSTHRRTHSRARIH